MDSIQRALRCWLRQGHRLAIEISRWVGQRLKAGWGRHAASRTLLAVVSHDLHSFIYFASFEQIDHVPLVIAIEGRREELEAHPGIPHWQSREDAIESGERIGGTGRGARELPRRETPVFQVWDSEEFAGESALPDRFRGEAEDIGDFCGRVGGNRLKERPFDLGGAGDGCGLGVDSRELGTRLGEASEETGGAPGAGGRGGRGLEYVEGGVVNEASQRVNDSLEEWLGDSVLLSGEVWKGRANGSRSGHGSCLVVIVNIRPCLN
jgi:hypothetical protein